MQTAKELRRFDQVAFRHTVMDGLTEMAGGLFLVLVALALPVGRYALFLYLAPLAFIPVLRSLQRRFTYPRIGYVEPIADKPKQLLPGIALYAVLVIAAFLTIVVLTGGGLAKPDYALLAERIYVWAPALAGVLLAGGQWYLASRSGFSRFFVFTLVSVALGVAVSVACVLGEAPVFEGRLGGLQVYLGMTGALWLFSGLIVFVRFLHRHPVQSPEANDVHR